MLKLYLNNYIFNYIEISKFFLALIIFINILFGSLGDQKYPIKLLWQKKNVVPKLALNRNIQ